MQELDQAVPATEAEALDAAWSSSAETSAGLSPKTSSSQPGPSSSEHAQRSPGSSPTPCGGSPIPSPRPRASRRRARHPCQRDQRVPDSHHPAAGCALAVGHHPTRRQARRQSARHADRLARAPPPRAGPRGLPAAVRRLSGCATRHRRRRRSAPAASPARHQPPAPQPRSTALAPEGDPPAPPWPPPSAAAGMSQRRDGRVQCQVVATQWTASSLHQVHPVRTGGTQHQWCSAAPPRMGGIRSGFDHELGSGLH